MSDFSQEIQNFQRYGDYTYKFDSVGNMIFDSSSIDFSQVYLACPLKNIIYSATKIESLYNTEFEEFIPQSVVVSTAKEEDLQQKLDVIEQENISLKSQLDSVISQNENTSTVADSMATKQVILDLRKAAGQGRVDSDFSDTFPYTPIRKNKT